MPNNSFNISRRGVIAASLGAGISATAPAKQADEHLDLDLRQPADNLTAYLKMRAGLASGDYYFWFTGGLDLAVAGEPIVPIITVESLLLRQVKRLPNNVFHITDYEASIYRDPATGELADKILNPVTQREVKALHYREGPVPFEWRADRQPRLLGMDNPFKEQDKVFGYPYKRVADSLWMTKASYFNNRPHWLSPKEWPLASPAENINVASISTLKASWSDITDPAQDSVPTEFFYQATSGWLPWMLMGQRPGHVIWHESGMKLADLNDAPADTLAIMRAIHPQWFRRPVPWQGFTNLFLQYKAQREPTR